MQNTAYSLLSAPSFRTVTLERRNVPLFTEKDADSQKAKVLFFIPSLAGGGAERVMTDILHHIQRKSINPVLVLLYPYEDSPYKQFLTKDIPVIVAGRASDSLFEKMKQIMRFLGTVLKVNPDVIVSMLTHGNIMALFAGLLLRKKVIVCEHIALGELIRTKEGRRMLRIPTESLVRMFYRFASRIITVSKGIAANLREEFNVPDSAIEVIYNPLDLHRIAALEGVPIENPFFGEGVPTIVSVGRLEPQKDFSTLIRSFSRVVERMDARLIILGEGSERKLLTRLCVDLSIAEKVSLAGFQINPYNFVSRATIFALSSRYEGFPIAMLEAMACGAPVVSTDCRYGPREILKDGHYGLLVPTGDIEALSRAMLELLNNAALREEFSRRGKERVKEFAPDAIARKYEEVICTVAFSSGLAWQDLWPKKERRS